MDPWPRGPGILVIPSGGPPLSAGHGDGSRALPTMGMPMPLVALLTWILTASGGLYLLTIWLIEYDREFQSMAATRLPIPVISTHALLAVTGLGVWALYLLTDR